MAAARYRDRHSVSRKKSDSGDALVLANILRTVMHAHRPLPQDVELACAIAVLARAQQDAVWSPAGRRLEPSADSQPTPFLAEGLLPCGPGRHRVACVVPRLTPFCISLPLRHRPRS